MKAARLAMGYEKQSEFADYLGESREIISRVESGARLPSERLLLKIESKAKISRCWLETGEGEMLVSDLRPGEVAHRIIGAILPILEARGRAGPEDAHRLERAIGPLLETAPMDEATLQRVIGRLTDSLAAESQALYGPRPRLDAAWERMDEAQREALTALAEQMGRKP